ncbi:Tetratricopeptide TPR_2 repeat protein [Methylobacterium sp. 4-46]|uniref:hypothetical protein n=1 Tax=unclassified Methylobacterium TaxID=2615210 RepID=UPI000152D10A|nr:MULTISPECIES: hypothetical protein [Methylobacterium]ACA19483.1 Tetratricopeptide TPR_2 repeat protein [Methylobacterium sp. 4-46]WFT78681.1 hypothetical protein QA634_25945 [Methylobacterium nodulans]
MGRTGTGRCGARLLIALATLLLGTAGAAAAKLVAVAGSEQRNFGRIALTFDQTVKVTAKVSGSILVIRFREPAGGALRDRLAAELPGYVGQMRRDPDGSGLRIALQRPFGVNVLEAAEKVFVDLLPETWTGLPPGLPPEVVADLAKRAEEAEARLRREALAARPPQPLRLETAELPTLHRLTVRLPRGAPAELEQRGRILELALPGAYTVAPSDARIRLRPAAEGLTAEAGPDRARLALTLAPGYEGEGYRDEDGYTIDLRKAADPEAPEPAAARAEAPGPARPAARTETPPGELVRDNPGRIDLTREAPAREAPARENPVRENPARENPAREAPAAAEAAPVPDPRPAGPVEGRVARSGETARIAFPFAARPPASLFERGGIATLVFETPGPVRLDPAALPPGFPARLAEAPRQDGAYAVLRLALEPGIIAQLAAEGTGWTLVLGDGSLPPGDLLGPQRGADGAGRPAVTVPLAQAGSVFWLTRNGERVAVVTARGPLLAGVPKRARFVDFELLPSRQGVAVLALADDLVVRPGLAEVVISRAGGLAVSPIAPDPAEAGPPLSPDGLAVQADRWRIDRSGDVLARIRAAQQAAAAADRPRRSPARLDLARVLLANGLDAEAGAVLAFAGREDAVVALDRGARILSAIAAFRLGRDARAAEILGDAKLARDPEIRLWRAMLDARGGRVAGPAVLAALKSTMPVAEAYPDELRLPVLLAAASLALDARDLTYAQRMIAAAASLGDAPLARDQVALLRARLTEQIGQEAMARGEYQRLIDGGAPPVAAEAALRFIDLAQAGGAVPREEILARLERLALLWHGDRIEAETLARLSRAYAEAGRWRDAFATARKATRLFPEHPATRSLHQDTVGLFADLFLTDKGAKLGRVEALALYYDFKEFTPLGRQGDEIVRGLADRLVALDLLDAAADLLQYQVDKRLTGAARATVAARLASIRLMDEKPLLALQVLQATRLPELPARLREARILLEARALSDLSRTDLALELVEGLEGGEVAQLRADILWGARRWREAGEAHEALAGTRWREAGPLGEAERTNVMRAAIAYALAEEGLSLDRLRAKFMPKMAESPDARTFALVSAPNAIRGAAFREAAGRVISAETLTSFLRAYRARYPESAVPERGRPAAEPGPEARRAGGAPPG